MPLSFSGAVRRRGGYSLYYNHFRYYILTRTRQLSDTTETSTSQVLKFAEGYDGTTVEFQTKPGTKARLEAIGVRDQSKATKAVYPGMAEATSGWGATNARFKAEGGQVTVALGKPGGKALEIVNDGIIDFKAISEGPKNNKVSVTC